MCPTLSDGDDILVDCATARERLRDGLYVLRREDALLVKRLAANPVPRRLPSRGHPAYPEWLRLRPRHARADGRVVWAGRKVS